MQDIRLKIIQVYYEICIVLVFYFQIYTQNGILSIIGPIVI
jgi:hypothetical protein